MADPEDIRGWHRLDAATTTSGRLQEGDPARLAEIGVRHVINLALDDHPEALRDEAERLAALGIGYSHIPVPFDAPQDAHFDAFREVIERIDAPVHVHCIMNWRVSAFFYRLNRLNGMADGEAASLMHRHWNPLTSDNPHAPAWAAFTAAESLANRPIPR